MSTNHTRVLISFDLLFFSNSDFGSPFDRACFEGRLPVVRALLTIIDVNDREIVGSALHGASQEGHLEVVEALLAAGIDVNAISSSHNHALYLAIFKHHAPVVEALLAAKADPNKKIDHSRTHAIGTRNSVL